MPRAPLPPEDDTSVDGDDPSDEVPSDLESTEVDLESDSEASEPEASRTELNEDPAPAPAPAPRKPPARGKDAFSEVVPPAPQGRALAGPRRPARVTSRPLAPPGVPARSQPAEVGA